MIAYDYVKEGNINALDEYLNHNPSDIDSMNLVSMFLIIYNTNLIIITCTCI